MQMKFEVENLKCGGCARTIEDTLGADPRVARVTVDVANHIVEVDTGAGSRQDFAATLARIGYPEKGSIEGLRSAAAVAKSFVSCAVGRVSGGA